MDEARRQALMAELEDVDRDLDRLGMYREGLRMRLGIQVEDDREDQGKSPTPPPAGQLTDDLLALVYDQEFHGWTMPKAAAEVLRRWSPEPHHRPLKTGQLLDALRKGGLSIAESRILYRSLYHAPRLKNVKGGRWGLREWYPADRNNKAGAGRQEPLVQGAEDPGEEDNVSHLAGASDEPTQKEAEAS